MNTKREKKTRRVIVWMSPTEAENLLNYGYEHDMSASAVVRAALREYMNNDPVDVPGWMYFPSSSCNHDK